MSCQKNNSHSPATFTEITEEEFDANYTEALDAVLSAMAENAEINSEMFYAMACLLENLRFFSPVLYGVFQNAWKK